MICAYCGSNEKVKRNEHLFPKCAYKRTKDQKVNVIKISCCESCNSEKSKHDDKFFQLISALGNKPRKQFDNYLKNKNAVHKHFGMKEIPLPNPEDIVNPNNYGNGDSVFIQSDNLHAYLRYLFKGIYFHYTGEFFTNNFEVNVSRDNSKDFDNIINSIKDKINVRSYQQQDCFEFYFCDTKETVFLMLKIYEQKFHCMYDVENNM